MISLTTVWCAQVHFQGPCSREALVALWEGADTGGLMGSVVVLLHDCLWLSLPPAAVVHQMGLQVPLTPKPDSARLAGEDVLWKDTERYKGGYDIRVHTVLYLRISIKIKSLHTWTHAYTHILLLFYTSTVLTLKACVKRLFHQILSCCISLCCYHWVGALSQGQTRTLDHLLTEASLLSWTQIALAK